jgi:tetratricopeptide (TPR) repeat protein
LVRGVEAVCVLSLSISFLIAPSIKADVEEARDLIAKKKWQEAVIALRSEIARDPREIEVQVDLARALVYLGRREEALNVLEGSIRREKGKKKDWLIQQSQVFSRIFVTNATFQIYQDGLNLLQIQKYRQAREKFEKALLAEPSNVEILTRLGQAYLLDGDHDSAAEQLKTARRLNPYEPEIRLWLGRAMHLRGELTEALQELRSSKSELAQSEIAPIWVADALEASGQKNLALQTLEEDQKANPMHVMSLVNEAKLKVQLAEHNSEMLWSARQDLQNALSRVTDYLNKNRSLSEGELGLEYPVEPKDFRDEIQSSLQKVQSKLDEVEGGKSHT